MPDFPHPTGQEAVERRCVQQILKKRLPKDKNESKEGKIGLLPLKNVQSLPLLKILNKIPTNEFISLYKSTKWIKEFIDDSGSQLIKFVPQPMEISSENISNLTDQEIEELYCTNKDYFRFNELIIKSMSSEDPTLQRLIQQFADHHIEFKEITYYNSDLSGVAKTVELLKAKKLAWSGNKDISSFEPMQLPWKMEKIWFISKIYENILYAVTHALEKTSYLSVILSNLNSYSALDRSRDLIKKAMKMQSRLQSDHVVRISTFPVDPDSSIDSLLPEGVFHLFKIADQTTDLHFLVILPVSDLPNSGITMGVIRKDGRSLRFSSKFAGSFGKVQIFWDEIYQFLLNSPKPESSEIMENIKKRYFPEEFRESLLVSNGL